MPGISATKALLKASPALAKVVKSAEITRPLALKAIWVHIKENKLQDPVVKTQINNDQALKDIFGTATMKQTQIMGGLSKNLEKIVVPEMAAAATKKA